VVNVQSDVWWTRSPDTERAVRRPSLVIIFIFVVVAAALVRPDDKGVPSDWAVCRARRTGAVREETTEEPSEVWPAEMSVALGGRRLV